MSSIAGERAVTMTNSSSTVHACQISTSSVTSDNLSVISAVKTHLAECYGFCVGAVGRLDGYDDVNLHITVCDKPFYGNDHNLHDNSCTHGLCLKIINSDDSKRPGKIAAVNSVMKHLSQQGIPTQEVIPDIHGRELSSIQLNNGTENSGTRVVCLRSFLAGRTLRHVTITSAHLRQLGAFVADVTSKLKSFHHPFFDTFSFSWSLDNVPLVTNKLSYIHEQHRRQLVEDVLQLFEDTVVPRMSLFTRGQIHGDIQQANILISEYENCTAAPQISQSELQIVGLIDFHDSHFSYAIHELAILVAHLMMNTRVMVPLQDIGRQVLAGYHTMLSLNQAELVSFDLCVASRLSGPCLWTLLL